MLSARAAAGVHRATMSALIVIFVFVIFQFLAPSRRAFPRDRLSSGHDIGRL
jgi:hypothetical protein